MATGEPWFEPLRGICEGASRATSCPYPVDTVLYYLSRWCQKTSREHEPDLAAVDRATLKAMAVRIVANLAESGETVERFVDGDRDEWTALKRVLLASARARLGEAGDEFADEALSKIALVLLTGTRPSLAAEELARGPEGPKNEYVFHAPFEYWARSIVLHIIVDEHRREARERREPMQKPKKKEKPLPGGSLRSALDALPELVHAIKALPPVQRSVIVLSLSRAAVDEIVRERFHELAPDLFSLTTNPPVSDNDIAERLGTTPLLVRANRSAARVKLAKRDPGWALLLDGLLPHRSTRSAGASGNDLKGARPKGGGSDGMV